MRLQFDTSARLGRMARLEQVDPCVRPARRARLARVARLGRAALLVLVLLVLACTRNPVTGRRELTLMSESQEISLGRDSDPGIVATYGLYPDSALAAYVDRIGQELARVSHRPNLKYTFRILDSPVINAFALPGGFIYVTRGILAHVNDEAELAMVLGHEIGHVTARHGVRQYSRATLAGLGLGLGGLFVPEVARFGRLAETALGLLFLKYGRDDENEADELGVRYSFKAGYDPRQGAGLFEVLDRQQQESGQSLPGWLSTHPAPADRVQHTLALARQVTGNRRGLRVGEATFKKHLEGLVYGDDPRQGFAEGNVFKHPDLEFEMTFPVGWRIQNTPSAVLSQDPDARAQMQLTLEESGGLDVEAWGLETARRAEANLDRARRLAVGGWNAWEAVLRLQEGASTIPVYLLGIQQQRGGRVYQIVGVARSGFGRWLPYFEDAGRSFRRLRDPEALAVQPARVTVVLVERPGTLEEIVAAHPEVPVPLAKIALLNNLQPGSRLSQGYRLKLVRPGGAGKR